MLSLCNSEALNAKDALIPEGYRVSYGFYKPKQLTSVPDSAPGASSPNQSEDWSEVPLENVQKEAPTETDWETDILMASKLASIW